MPKLVLRITITASGRYNVNGTEFDNFLVARREMRAAEQRSRAEKACNRRKTDVQSKASSQS